MFVDIFYCKFAPASICSHSTLFKVHSKLQTSCPMPGGNGSTLSFLLAEFMTCKSCIAFPCIFYIFWLCVDRNSLEVSAVPQVNKCERYLKGHHSLWCLHALCLILPFMVKHVARWLRRKGKINWDSYTIN